VTGGVEKTEYNIRLLVKSGYRLFLGLTVFGVTTGSEREYERDGG